MNSTNISLIQKMNQIISEYEARITVRQLYYQLVSRGFIENSIKAYKNMDRVLTIARKEGTINPFALVDRSKPLIKQPSWNGLKEFVETVRESYKRTVWDSQPEYVEVWVEKDALAGVLQPITNYYDVFLAVGRGYQSFTNKVEAAKRFEEYSDRNVTILYFGDFDPTGMDINRDIFDQMETLCSVDVRVERISLTPEQIKVYNLPSIPLKKTDTRTAAHVAEYGDVAVELDALPPNVLAELVKTSINQHLDFQAFSACKEKEKVDLTKINGWVKGLVVE